ncbi:hypothetical protein V6C03_05940 [Methyloligella sp. 2.7D]|uniref:hypothetical protein n=1 Tax=unclassified Methyloligella TaxID=2625955 RepID=UPI00157C27BA|nr:hypothetical protein [Methyloligella sp. GL2]QKP78542.1 hypothetical protein HT051_14510 [Methyloligella sp. GL2]
MQAYFSFHRVFAAVCAALIAVAISAGAAFAASDYVGKYETKDTQGKPMTITLADDGSASGQRTDEALKGTWKEKKNIAVIDWGDGWTTKIKKKGEVYRKIAFEGKKPEGKPARAKAKKVE